MNLVFLLDKDPKTFMYMNALECTRTNTSFGVSSLRNKGTDQAMLREKQAIINEMTVLIKVQEKLKYRISSTEPFRNSPPYWGAIGSRLLLEEGESVFFEDMATGSISRLQYKSHSHMDLTTANIQINKTTQEEETHVCYWKPSQLSRPREVLDLRKEFSASPLLGQHSFLLLGLKQKTNSLSTFGSSQHFSPLPLP